MYNKAYEFSLAIHRLSLTFPKFEQFELGSQLRRATKSIAMNIAEGYDKNESIAELKRFMKIALGSCGETRVQLEYCSALGYINDDQFQEYEAKYVEISKMLVKMIKEWQ